MITLHGIHDRTGEPIYVGTLSDIMNSQTAASVRCLVDFIHVFDYIEAIRLGYIKFNDIHQHYHSLLSSYEYPPVVQKCAFLIDPMEDDGIVNELINMISNFPLYGENFSSYVSISGINSLTLAAFKLHPEYDRCTMAYKDYDEIVFVSMKLDEDSCYRVEFEYSYVSGADSSDMDCLTHTTQKIPRTVDRLCAQTVSTRMHYYGTHTIPQSVRAYTLPSSTIRVVNGDDSGSGGFSKKLICYTTHMSSTECPAYNGRNNTCLIAK